MQRHYFGTDGIRGCVGKDPITADFALRLGHAAGKVLAYSEHNLAYNKGYLQANTTRPVVLIGKDTRVSGYMLEPALVAGLTSAGVDVLLAGPMPSPAIAYLTRTLRLNAGVVISASHNHYADNGIKFFSADGNKLPDDIELQIEKQIDLPMVCACSDGLGKARRIEDAPGRYIEFCKSTFPANFDLRQFRIVVDCAHGAAYHIAPHVFHELGAEVIPIGVHPTGFNINDGVGATSPKALAKAVVDNHAHYGIALDGDADRLQIVDSSGRIYNGDELLYVLAMDRLGLGLEMKGVVGTLMTNVGIENALHANQIQLVRARVGDRYVLEKLREHKWVLGAEGSGHILSLDKHTTGDGIISALMVLAAILRSGACLSALLKPVQLFSQSLINVQVSSKHAHWENYESILKIVELTNQTLGRDGRVLLRPSGTEPVLRVMVEAVQADLARHHAQAIAQTVKQAMT